MRRRFWFVFLLAMVGCAQQGQAPPPGTFNFPIAVEMTADGHTLLVANSNFDLRFNTGSIQTFNLDAIHAAIPGCGEDPCVFEDVSPFLVSDIGVGSHVAAIALSPDQDRVYLPVGANRNLTFLTLDSETGVLDCDATLPAGHNGDLDIPRCSEAFRRGNDGGIASERELSLVGPPVEVYAGRLSDIGGPADGGDFVMMPMRNGEVALFIDVAGGPERVPELVHVLDGFPDNLVTLTMEPGTSVGWMTAATTDTLSRVGVRVDENNPLRSFLYNAGPRTLGGIDDGSDTRDFKFHPTDPDTAFVLSRLTESVVEVRPNERGFLAQDVQLGDVYEVGPGPSRLMIMNVGGRNFAVTSCFNARKLFFIDIDHGALVAVAGGFSGPFEMAVDNTRGDGFLYVVDFTTSVVRVVDLSPLTLNETPVIVATLGRSIPIGSLTGN